MQKTISVILGILLISVPIIYYIDSKVGKVDTNSNNPVLTEQEIEDKYEVATLASGCFWCMEAIMQETPGVIEAISGYAGGEEPNPTYEDVYKEKTGHRESVKVVYDPEIITYEEVLDVFWRNIDPTDAEGQFVDKGFSYTTAIFTHDDDQEEIASRTKDELEDSGKFDKPIATEIIPFTTFYEAEEYHQDFYKKSALRYNSYKNASGREAFKEAVWKEIQKEEEN